MLTTTSWPQNPKIYQINTWVWLHNLSQEFGKPIQLDTVPTRVFQELARYHVDAVWLMGVWYRSPATRASALNYIHEYRGALPDMTAEDVVGSAYAIGAYEVDERIGGREGMAKFRRQLQKYNIKLITDFVPNHVATDHPWVTDHPEYFVMGELAQATDSNFFTATTSSGQDKVFAHGRDPYFPGWIDTAQFNAFSDGYRQAALATLREIATQCDGVRCDMAMLMMNQIFARTWGWLGLNMPPKDDYWVYLIPRVREANKHFLFIAETYWGLDHALQVQGFDYTYDKTMYDRLVHGDIAGVYAHMSADLAFLRKNIRFIENHDEPRAASSMGIERSKPAAALIATMPGATLLHDGQFLGRRVKLPVQIRRQPNERLHTGLRDYYLRLLEETRADIYRLGDWQLFRTYPACGTCQGHHNIIAYGWRHGDDFRVIAVNLSGTWSQAKIDLGSWRSVFAEQSWHVTETFSDTNSDYAFDALENGLDVDLDAYQAQILRFRVKRRTGLLLPR